MKALLLEHLGGESSTAVVFNYYATRGGNFCGSLLHVCACECIIALVRLREIKNFHLRFCGKNNLLRKILLC